MAIKISTYDPKFLPAYVELNRQWIEHYFQIEQMDLKQLQDPENTILQQGGEIFFALQNEVVLGVCAMIPHGPDSFELAKMVVSVEARGQGVGDRLMEASIAWARARGARSITLLSNTILEPAIRLYRKHGFGVVRLGDHPDYKRCNIEMTLTL